MDKFRRKPILVEAVQITREFIENRENIPWVTYPGVPRHSGSWELAIDTVDHGTVAGHLGDWIIRDPDSGLLKVRSDEVFRKYYEPAKDGI